MYIVHNKTDCFKNNKEDKKEEHSLILTKVKVSMESNRLEINQAKGTFLQNQDFFQRKTSQNRVKRTSQLNPCVMPSLEIEPRPHWWDASTLTTVLSLLPVKKK